MNKIGNSTLLFFSIILSLGSFFGGKYLANDQAEAKNKPNVTVQEIIYKPQKSDRPELQFFIMSFCPFGNQMEDVLQPVFELFSDKVNITPHYIFQKITDLASYCQSASGDESACLDEKTYLKSSSGILYSSLHGRQEANQNVREICAWNQVGNDKTTWWKFISLINKNCTTQDADTCWEEQGKEAGLDTNKVTECFNKEAFTLIDKEIEVTTKYQITSSPSVVINEAIFPPTTSDNQAQLKVGKLTTSFDKLRTPNVIKEALCASMNKTAKECETILKDLPNTVTGGCN